MLEGAMLALRSKNANSLRERKRSVTTDDISDVLQEMDEIQKQQEMLDSALGRAGPEDGRVAERMSSLLELLRALVSHDGESRPAAACRLPSRRHCLAVQPQPNTVGASGGGLPLG